jgi:bifunctional non-homologous end joining protein LigD
MSFRPRALPAGFIAPCLPTTAPHPPSGEPWLHEIKHDGFRVIARKNGQRVKLYSRPGNDLTPRFPLIAEALSRLRSRSCIIDGEAVACSVRLQPSSVELFQKGFHGCKVALRL